MHTDARQLAPGSEITGDICIVGAGAAGISMALEWIGTPYKVILLEGGGFEYDDKIQDLFDGKTTGQKYFPLRSSRLHYFGGTTNHWSGYCSTLDPVDFEKRSWVPHSGWPISRGDLDPFYARAQSLVDLGPYEYGAAYWQKLDPSRSSLPFDQQVLFDKMWQFSPPTRFGNKYKAEILRSRNLHLYTHANVTNILLHDNLKDVKELRVSNLEGKNHVVKARYFVLACCSIQNARLLLASNSQVPAGVGNQRDQVGRYFMEHVEIKSAELWLTQPRPMGLYVMNFGVTKARAELALTAEAQRKHQILNGTASFTPLAVARNAKPIIDLWNNKDPRKSREQLMNEFSGEDRGEAQGKTGTPLDRAYELFTRIEQAPNPDSRITLDTEKDALGMPKSKLHWILTPFEKRSIRKLYEIIGLQAGMAGIGRVRMKEFLHDEKDESWPPFTGGGWHHMGTTRMSDDPSKGVVDPNCRVHDMGNLYIAGSSCFTTAGAANPTLSLIALSLRLSDHLKETVKKEIKS